MGSDSYKTDVRSDPIFQSICWILIGDYRETRPFGVRVCQPTVTSANPFARIIPACEKASFRGNLPARCPELVATLTWRPAKRASTE